MSTTAVEVFRLAALRAPDAPAGSLAMIRLREPDPESEPDPREYVREDGTLQDFQTEVEETELVLPMALLDRQLRVRQDLWAPGAIDDWISETTGGPASAFTHTDDWGRYSDDVQVALQQSIGPNGLARRGLLRQPAGLFRIVRMVALLNDISSESPTATDECEVQKLLDTSLVVFSPGTFRSPIEMLVRPPAVADLKVVRLGSPRYVPAAIAHIENVMASETRDRTVRVLQQTESTVVQTSEHSEEVEKDLQTTSQVELIQEANKTIKDSSELQAGLTLSASYGPTVSATLNTSLARSQSREESTRSAATYSNQITQQARQRVIDKTLTQRTFRQLVESEETNRHAFTNDGPGSSNLTGIYRHVDQVQDAWIENYGKRMMLEFLVPQPAAMWRWARSRAGAGGDDQEPPPPKDPSDPSKDLTPEMITASNYLTLTGRFGAAGVKPTPPGSVELSASFQGDPANASLILFKDTSMKVPEGYRATHWTAQAVMWGGGAPNEHSWMVGVGEQADPVEDNSEALKKSMGGDVDFGPGSVVPVIMLGRGYLNMATSIRIHCELTSEARQAWQLDVYGRIMDAFRQQHQEWETRQAQAQAAAALSDPTTDAASVSPAVERTELRRVVLHELLGNTQDAGLFAGQAVVPGVDGDRPTLKLDVIAGESAGILFLEQAFEWDNMAWIHYPYYWAEKDQWRQALTDASAAGPTFLTAGSSRVVLPVRPGFEAAVNFFLTTGVMWDSHQVPTVDDPTYVGLAEELTGESAGSIDPSRTDLDPIRIPTDLVWLQPDGSLDPDGMESALTGQLVVRELVTS